MTNQQQQQQQQQQQHRFPKKLIDYLHVVKKLTRPGFSNVISTDAENVLEQIIKQRQQQVGDQDSSFMSKSTGCSRSGTISSTCGHNKHDSGLNDYDYCFRVKISPYACFPKDDIDSTTASTRSSKSTRSSTNTNINTSTTVEVMDTLDMDTKSSSTKVFPLSGILALIDDFTTYAIVSKDRYSRAGVSVHLSTSLTPYGIKNLRKLMPNDELDINVKIVKIGSRFGFTEACVICCNSGNIIANGKHTKFLEVGTRIQKFVLSSFMLPLLSWWCTASTLTLTSILASILTSKETSRLQQEQKEHTDHHSSSSSIQKRNLVGIQDLFKFELVNDVYKYENEITKVKGKVKGRGKGKINLNQYHMNPMGTCHGGAIAMAMERFATFPILEESKETTTSTIPSSSSSSLSNEFRLQSISLNYISSSKLEILFERELKQFNSMFAMIDIKATASNTKLGYGYEHVHDRPVANGTLHYVNFSADNDNHTQMDHHQHLPQTSRL
jgi:hypothetical protein